MKLIEKHSDYITNYVSHETGHQCITVGTSDEHDAFSVLYQLRGLVL